MAYRRVWLLSCVDWRVSYLWGGDCHLHRTGTKVQEMCPLAFCLPQSWTESADTQKWLGSTSAKSSLWLQNNTTSIVKQKLPPSFLSLLYLSCRYLSFFAGKWTVLCSLVIWISLHYCKSSQSSWINVYIWLTTSLIVYFLSCQFISQAFA